MVSVFGFGTSNQPSSSSSSSGVQDGADPAPKAKGNKPLDVVFLQDTTGSQGPYIQSARKAIRDICDKISTTSELSQDQIRFGLIAFRDHPPQDYTYVTKPFGFTSDVEVMQSNLASLIASGGGDGPEAQTAAIAAALEMDWAENAIKMAILITDAPPHGLGEVGDGFTESPDQNDPLELARQMSERGITLFVIACEPSLSKWKHAIDFYTALTQITSGRVFPLLMADKLGDFIVGTAIETIETEKLISEFEQVIVNDVYNNDKPVGDVMGNLQDFIKAKGIKINSVVVEDVYAPSAAATANVNHWYSAGKLGAARQKVSVVHEPRLQQQYQQQQQYYGGAPSAPAAPPAPRMQMQDISHSQAHRIVKQSMARNSSVTPAGMVDRVTGKSVPASSYSPSSMLPPS